MKKLPLWLLTLLLLLTGCDDLGPGNAAGRQPTLAGTRREPFGAGDIAVYDGLDRSTEYGSFRLELQMLDAVRGYPALQIYLADSGTNRATDIPPGKELVLVKWSAKLLESADDMPLSLGTWAEDLFLMVAERGHTYEPFASYGRLSRQLFGVLEPGEEQQGIVGFVVDEHDLSVTVVFMPSVNSGLWFAPDIAEADRGEHRIDPADWGLGDEIYNPYHAPDSLPDAADPLYGGTLGSPLPPGEWGVYRAGGPDTALELELMVLSTERGGQVLERLGRQADPLMEGMDPETQELLAVQIRANLLLDVSGGGASLGAADFLLRHENGELSRQEYPTAFSPDGALRTMFAGAAQEGWIYFIVGRGEHLWLSPQHRPETALWFTTDPDARLPEDLLRFESTYSRELLSDRDGAAPEGSPQNPLRVGEAGRYAQPAYAADIRIVEVLRAQAAEQRLDPISAAFWQPAQGEELLCVRVEITLLHSDGPDRVDFSGGQFGLVSSQRIAGEPAIDPTMVTDSVGEVAVGQTVQGDLLFQVDTDDPAPSLIAVPADNAPLWFELSAYGPAQAI